MQSVKDKFSWVTVSFLVAGLIIGFLGGWYGKEYKNNQKSEITNETGSMMQEIDQMNFDTTQKESVEVFDQPAGSSVQVANVTLAEDGWVAVREEATTGVLGNILGATHLKAGVHNSVEVELLRNTLSGREYAVVIYRDNGDNAFNHNFDSLIVDEGVPVSGTFKAF